MSDLLSFGPGQPAHQILDPGVRAHGPRGGGAAAVVFLLRDDFTSDEAAPLASPRTCEPGPGTLTVVQASAGATFSILDSKLEARGVEVYNNCRIRSDAFTRTAGLGVVFDLQRLIPTSPRHFTGWHSSINPTTGTLITGLINNNVVIMSGGSIVTNASINTADHLVFLILRSVGDFFIHKSGSNWLLLWVSNVSSVSPLYWGHVQYDFDVCKMDYVRATQLPAPWDDDDGIATQILSGARSPGDTWTHEADHLTYATITTLPSSGQIEFRFRIQDASNYWQVTVDSTGSLDLDEVVAGTPTQRGTAAGVVSAGGRIGWAADGSTIAVYDSTARRINYTSATNFQTETDGELETEGTGGSVTGIEVWPRTLSGAALAALEAVVNAP